MTSQAWWPGDRQLVDGALSEARQAGVGEHEIRQILDEARAGPQDGFMVPILAGRLAYASRNRTSTRGPSGPSIFDPRKMHGGDDW